MSRNPIAIALLTVSALLMASGALVAQERPPRPEKYFVPFSAPQNVIDHARFFKEEVIKVSEARSCRTGPRRSTLRPLGDTLGG